MSEKVLQDPLLNEGEAAALLTCSPGLLRKWRHKRSGGPRVVQLGRWLVRYRLSDLNAFVASQSKSTKELPRNRKVMPKRKGK